MTDLERRALLGDKQAQEECTKKGIFMSCPFCGSGSAVSFIETDEQPYANHIQGFILCRSCGFSSDVFLSRKFALAYWNNRPIPPIGYCKDCVHAGEWSNDEANCHVMDGCIVGPDDFCSEFEPKGADENVL